MAKHKPSSKATEPEPIDDGEDYPSRANYKGTYLPKDIYEELDAYAAAEDRSAAFFVRKAVLKLLAELRKGGEPGPSLRKPKKA